MQNEQGVWQRYLGIGGLFTDLCLIKQNTKGLGVEDSGMV